MMNVLPNSGVATDFNLKQNAIGQVKLKYEGRHMPPNQDIKFMMVECEIYEENGTLWVHSCCPKCGNSFKVNANTKSIDYDKDRGLFIEPFECPWEMSGERQDFGLSLCRLNVAYDGFTIKDA